MVEGSVPRSALGTLVRFRTVFGGRSLQLSGLRKLSTEFLGVSAVIMIVVMISAGYAITTIVSRDAVRGTALSSALFLQAMMGEHVGGTTIDGSLSDEAVAELDELFATQSFRQRFPYMEIWSPTATVLYSNSKELIGRQFAPPPGLTRALGGEVAAEYTDLLAGEHTSRGFDTAFLEIYVPLRAGDGSVAAIAEIHEQAEPLRAQLRHLTTITWLIVIGSTSLIGASLFGVVRRGERIIGEQQANLRDRVAEAEQQAAINRELRERIRKASIRVSSLNEGFLKRIGADLHDGPTQLLSLSVLQAGSLRQRHDPDKRDPSFETLVTTLRDAAADIRAVSKGLLIAEASDGTLLAILEQARLAHELRTGASVAAQYEGFDIVLPPVLTSCAYRFVQEGLNNAHRYSNGGFQAIAGRLVGGELVLSIVNEIAHGPSDAAVRHDHGLGLVGLRSRAETLGGKVTFNQIAPDRARLELMININDDAFDLPHQ